MGGRTRNKTRSEIGTFAPFGEFDSPIASVAAMGIDSGATLVKLCVRSPAGDRYFATWPSPSRDRVLEVLMELAPERLGITGCGAAGLLAGLDRGAANPIEFDAWGRGANEILAQTGQISDEPYLLVSIGTGTSALRVEGDRVERVDGTALGGGTALGLGLALTGCQTHDELARLAARGERGGVDLLISDIYEKNALPIAAEATAASFGKLAHALDRERDGQFERTGSIPSGDPSGDRRRSVGPSARPEDLAAAVMGLVAENIALLSNARATVAGVRRIVYGGSTLYENPTLVGTVQLLTSVMGFEVIVLPHSGHAGALGAMLLSD